MNANKLRKVIISLIALNICSMITLLYLFNSTDDHPLFPIVLVIVGHMLVMVFFINGLVKAYPVYRKSSRIARLNRIIYDLLHESVYIRDTQKFYDTVLNSALDAISVGEKGSILLTNPETNKLKYVAAVGYDFDMLKNTYIELDQTFLSRESKGDDIKTVVIHDPFEYDRKQIDEKNIQDILDAGSDDILTTISTPIFHKGVLYGMINIDSPKIHAFDSYDIEMIELFAIEVTNVLQLFASLEENKYYIEYDTLTGIHNRRYMNDLIHKLHKEMEEKQGIYSVASIDLNNLKINNDKYGHACGDALLVKFSQLFEASIGEGVTIGRYGGDEFIVLFPKEAYKEVDKTLSGICDSFNQQPLKYSDQNIKISFSYGIASFPEDASSHEELISISDRRMYIQKKATKELNKKEG